MNASVCAILLGRSREAMAGRVWGSDLVVIAKVGLED
jgi:hypothetical protein